MTNPRIENTIPVLSVGNLNRSVEFYRDVLEFEVAWNAGTICSVARDGCQIMLRVQESASPGTVWIGVDGHSIFQSIGGREPRRCSHSRSGRGHTR